MSNAGGTSTVAAGLVVSYVGSDFSHTFKSASAFNNASAVGKAYIIITLYSSVWGFALLAMMYFGWYGRGYVAYQRKAGKLGEKKKSMVTFDRVGLIHPDHAHDKHGGLGKAEAAMMARQKLAAYVASVFPAVYEAKTVLAGMKSEIMHNHLYMKFFFKLGHSAAPVLKVVEMITAQSYLLFLLAVFYDLNYPDDDGSCPQFKTESECLNRKYILDSKSSYCQWTGDSSGFSCLYAEPTFSITTGMYVAMMISLATCLSMEPLEYCMTLLAAPSGHADEHEGKNAVGASLKIAPSALITADPLPLSLASGKGHSLRSPSPLRRSMSIVRVDRLASIRHLPMTTVAAHDEASAFAAQIVAEAKPLLQRRESQRQVALSLAARTSGAAVGQQVIAGRRTPHAMTSVSISAHNGDLTTLWTELPLQRALLSEDDRIVFDKMWGLDHSSGEFLRKVKRGTWTSRKKTFCVKEAITREVLDVETTAHSTLAVLSTISETEKGFEILQAFVKDLLGRNTPAARIFATKAEADFVKVSATSYLMKALLGTCIFLLNAFFIYYTILKGYNKGLRWQSDYLKAWIVQLFLDMMLFETVQCVWIHVVVPYLVAKEVQRVFVLLQQTVAHLCDSSYYENQVICLNAPDYLFVSHRLADAYPNLVESTVVRAFASHLPSEVGKVWLDKLKRFEPDQQGFVWFRMPDVILSSLLIQLVAYAPMHVQSLVIRVTEPLLLAAMTFGALFFLKRPIFISVLGLPALFVAVWWARRPAASAPATTASMTSVVPLTSPSAEAAAAASVDDLTPLHLPERDRSQKSSEMRANRIPSRSMSRDEDESHYLPTNSIDIRSHTTSSYSSSSRSSLSEESEYSDEDDSSDSSDESLPSYLLTPADSFKGSKSRETSAASSKSLPSSDSKQTDLSESYSSGSSSRSSASSASEPSGKLQATVVARSRKMVLSKLNAKLSGKFAAPLPGKFVGK